ncbi:MAG: glycosyltransferase [Chloroflexi bacterium]|nr:glycosyltransferase [Chloroflexota bacterium]
MIHILHYAGPPVIGGVEITIAYHARLLARRGYQVQVIAGRGGKFDPRVDFLALPEADSRHAEVLAVSQELTDHGPGPRFEALRARLRSALQKAVAPEDTLIVHNALTLHKNLALTAALHDLATEGRRLIGWCHDFAWLDALYIPVLRPGFPWDLLRTPWPNTRYVTVSEHRRQQLARLLDLSPEAIEVIPPGVAPEQLLRLSPHAQRLVDALDLWEADPLFLLPARITRRKNIQMAIRIIAALKDHFPNPVLVVTGPPGPHNPSNVAYLEQLQALRRDLGLTRQVHFLYEHGEDGEPLLVDDTLLAEFYALADALLFPSLREGFGIPVLEAGLLRLPVFAADIPPVRESAGDNATLFDPQGDPQEAAARIAERLKDDPTYRLRRRVLSRYTWDAIVDEQLIPLLA